MPIIVLPMKANWAFAGRNNKQADQVGLSDLFVSHCQQSLPH